MTDIKYVHHLFKLTMNKLDSGTNYDLPPAFIDTILWEALNEYIEIFYSGNTKNYQITMESTQQRIDMLKDFIVSYPDVAPLTSFSTTDYNGVKIQRFTNYSNYRHLLRSTGKDSTCNNIIILDVEQQNNIDYKLAGKFTKPSSKWNRGYIYAIKDKLFTYSENPLSELYISFIKNPVKPFFGGYDTIEYLSGDTSYPSASSPVINVELDKAYIHILVDIMTQIASDKINDFNKSQIFQQKINLV